MSDRHRKIITCSECGQQKPHHGRGLCNSCWLRMRRGLRFGAVRDLIEQGIARGELLEAIADRLSLSVEKVYAVADAMDRNNHPDHTRAEENAARAKSPCGTHARYEYHRTHGEPIDATCRAAERAYDLQKHRRARERAA